MPVVRGVGLADGPSHPRARLTDIEPARKPASAVPSRGALRFLPLPVVARHAVTVRLHEHDGPPASIRLGLSEHIDHDGIGRLFAVVPVRPIEPHKAGAVGGLVKPNVSVPGNG